MESRMIPMNPSTEQEWKCGHGGGGDGGAN